MRIAINLAERMLDRDFPHRSDGNINRSRLLNARTDCTRGAFVVKRKPGEDVGIEQHFHVAYLSAEKPSNDVVRQRIVKPSTQLQLSL